MKLLIAAFIFSQVITLSCAAEKENLPSDAKLRIGVLKRPDTCSRKSKKGDTLDMHYTGTLFRNGEKFDSSRDRDSPFTFKLGAGQVIKGWDQGLMAMCEGERRKLTIPSDLGYGGRGAGGSIKGGDTLVFDVELLKIHGNSAGADDF